MYTERRLAMTFITITIFALLLYYIPANAIQYLAFEPIFNKEQKKNIIKLFIVITVLELILFSVLFEHGFLSFNLLSLKLLMLIYWPPYVATIAYFARDYMYQNIFVAGLQGMCILAIHTLTMNAVLYFVPPEKILDYMPSYLVLHTFLYSLLAPVLLKFFKRSFYTHNTVHVLAFWKYMAWLPITLTFYTGIMALDPAPLAQLYLIPRLVQAIAAIFIAIILYAGLKEMSQQVNLQRKNHLLLVHMKSLSDYTSLLQEKQKLMSIFRHDSRHQLQMISELIQNKNQDAALQFLRNIDNELYKTWLPQWCTNPTIASLLREELNAVIDQDTQLIVSLPLQKHLPFETDLGQLLLELIRATALTQNKPIPSALTLLANVSSKEITLFLQVHDVENLLPNEEGVPQKESFRNFNADLNSFATVHQAIFHYHTPPHMISFYLSIPYAT